MLWRAEKVTGGYSQQKCILRGKNVLSRVYNNRDALETITYERAKRIAVLFSRI